MNRDPLIPMIAVVTDIRVDTPDVKPSGWWVWTGGSPFLTSPASAPCCLCPGWGRPSSPSPHPPPIWIFWNFPLKVRLRHRVAPRHGAGAAGDPSGSLWQRLPGGYGLPGKDLVFIAGGIGLAPLRSVIRYVRANRSWYGQVDIVYGARSRDDLVDYPEIVEQWCQEEGLRVHLTIDREQPGWDGHVGFVPGYVRELI